MRKAVVSVISESSIGKPVSTSASTPKAITVGTPLPALAGCPLTYLNAYRSPSVIGINSITPISL